MTDPKTKTTPIIVFPLKYLRVLLQAVTALRKVKAVAANTWRLVQIGHKEDWLLHTDLSALEVYLAELLDTARTMKAKTFTISIGSGDGRGLV